MAKSKEAPCSHPNSTTKVEGRNEVERCTKCGAVLSLKDVGYDPKTGYSKEK